MADKSRAVRRSQYISPFGVGAIVDMGNESLIAEDISKWQNNSGTVIHLGRLEKRLRIREFRMPPIPRSRWDRHPPKLPYFRFPQWVFCPSCRNMTLLKVKDEIKGKVPKCTNLKCRSRRELVPMRFVMACEKGHLSDVDWHYWAHAKQHISKDGRCSNGQLSFISKPGKGGGLGALFIQCSCGAERSLEGIAKKGSMKEIGVRCTGKQPWQFIVRENREDCKYVPEVYQRGATNLYYPKTVSALDIPTETSNLQEEIRVDDLIKVNGMYSLLVEQLESAEGGVAEAIARKIAQKILDTDPEINCSLDYVLSVAKGENTPKTEDTDRSDIAVNAIEILQEEWPVLISADACNEYFETEIGDISSVQKAFGLNNLIDKLVMVKKLREVRVLRGFHRVSPGDEDMLVRSDLGKGLNWLPGMEVFGEGIFISFDEREIENWLADNESEIDDRLFAMQQRWLDKKMDYLPEPTPRFVMLHTFAHLLIRQLSFECGYSASSLRERIYAADSDSEIGAMAGILIYTADSDSEGSLGGLVRQGLPERIIPTILTALERSKWCSSDPICRELPGQGMQGLNRAACHSCTLLSETSCISNNVLLDRMLILGDDSNPYGFFSSVLNGMQRQGV